MSKNKDIISIGKSGMNTDSHPSNLKENEYTFALNSNIEDSSGNGIPMLQNEPSNLLCSKFKEGYKYLAHVVSINKDITYFFLTNPDTKHSEIGYIENINYVKSKDDIEINCGCNTKIDLGEPLEDTVQPELCTYRTIISDECNNCLNFSIYHPIKDVLLKEEKGKTTLYWTDNYNPPRYIELHDLDKYKVNSSTACGEEGTPTCLDCSKLLIFKPFLPFVVNPISIENGGQLKRGTYEVLGAYCDKQGNEITNYGLISNPISIFDKNNDELSQENLADITNFSIKLNVEGIDDKGYDYYKIAVIQKADIDGTVSYWFNGIYPTSNKEFYISTDKDKTRTTLTHLLAYKPFYERTEGMSSSNGYMFQYGLTARKEVNLQPIANLLGGFLRWSTSVAKEELYNDGIASSKYKGYMRGEVYPFSIRFNFKNGYKTSPFLLINRPPTADELETVNTIDTQSVLQYSKNCNINNRNKRWQYYDTSSVLGYCQNNYDNLMDCNMHPENCVTRHIEQMCDIDYVGESGAGTVELKILDNYTNLVDYIDDHREELCDPNSLYYNAVLCGYISNTYPNEHCSPVFEDTCDTPVLDDTKTEIYLTDIVNENTTLVWKTLNQYDRIPIPRNCSFYVAPVNSNFIYDYDSGFTEKYISNPVPPPAGWDMYSPVIFKYMDNFIGNDTCDYALELNFYIRGTQGYGLYNKFDGEKNYNDLLINNTVATAVDLGNDFKFYNKIHKNANWVKGRFPNNEDKILFEISKINRKKDLGWAAIKEPLHYFANHYNWRARYTIYSYCGGTPIYTGVFDMQEGLLIELDKNIINSSEFYIAVDTPIHTENGSFITDDNPPKYFLYPSSGCYTPMLRHRELDKVIINYDALKFGKIEYYYSNCRYAIPQVKDCNPIPYNKGKFGYYESIVTYPDNNELYNSKELNISVADLPSEYVYEFVEYYVEEENEGNYTLKLDTDFRCKPIRHYKFPTNRVSPFMSTEILDGFNSSLIYPIGVSLDIRLVNSFLDIAVKNGLITQSERDDIIGYEILRGDRVVNKSVLGKGLLFDVYKYIENNDEIYYPNYPFNDLGKDKLNYNNKYRDSLTTHPFNSEKNNRYTFISPDIYFSSINSFNEVDLEGYVYGKSRGVFSEVEGHSKYVLLSSGAYRLAGLLALGEVALEWGIMMGQATIEASKTQWAIIGFANSINIGAFTSTAALISLGVLKIFSSALRYGKYRYEWLKIIKEFGQPKNFASYYTGVGYYNYFEVNNEEDNYLRGVSGSKYLKAGRYAISEYNTTDRIFFNNVDREESLYVSFGDFPFEYNNRYKNYDNSNNGSFGSRFRARDRGCDDANITEEYLANVASPYVSIKNYIFDQYGEVDSIKWLTTGKVVNLYLQNSGRKGYDCDIVYGGDIYISRFAIKRKVPFFLANAVDIADLTPFNYIDYRNLGSPRYYINYEISDSYNKGSYIFPTIKSSYNLDCERKDYFYVKNPSRFYLYYYGFPYFLVESEINTNFRYSGKGLKNKYYPSFNDYVKLTQEKQVSIKEREKFLYNFTYSKNVTRDGSYLLPSTYSKNKYDTLYDSPNGVIYSNQDSSEQDLIDPWLVYKPYNYYQFNTKYGKLVSLEDIESGQVLARFSNTFAIFNAIDVLKERLTKYNDELGNGGIFAQRPITFKQADLGYAGTQHHAFVRTPFGHFWADAQRGEVIMVNSNGKGLKDIVGGMSNWFKEHLPFKILRGGIKNLTSLDLDNTPLGIGLTMVWDNRYSRLLITKRDYIVKDEYKGKLIYENGVFYDTDAEGNKNNIVNFNDNTIFKDVSWTIGYSLKIGRWLSYYSYTPDYYIGYQNYFKSGKNFSPDESENGLWSHLLTNKSYQVFYGKKYPFIIELPYKEEYTNKLLHSVRYWLDSRRYHNDYDFAEKRDIGFNKAIVYNHSNNSGLLNLIVEQKNNLYQKTQYPKIHTGSMDILVTENDKKWSFNHFYNLVRDEYNNNPIWKRDDNNIMKELNISALTYKNIWKDRLRGDWFLVRLIQDKESRFKIIFKWLEGKENIYR